MLARAATDVYDGLPTTLEHWVRGARSFEVRTFGPVAEGPDGVGPRLPEGCALAYETHLQ